MSYIDKLNLFYDLLQCNPPSQHAQLIYHTLLMINNKCGWTEWFQRTNLNLCGITGISEKTLINARNELKQIGLIDFIPSKKRNEKTKYRILDCKIDGTNSSLSSSPYSSPNAVQPPVQSPDINRLKTKTKKKKDTNVSKKKFAEYVSMSQGEYDKLVQEYGATAANRMIEILDNYKGSKGKTYKSDYRAILTWVVDRYKQDQLRSGGNMPDYSSGDSFI